MHGKRVNAVAFSPDGQMILTGSDDDAALLWEVHTGQPLGGPMPHKGPVRSVAFGPDGQTFLTGSDDNTARLWNVSPPARDDSNWLQLSIQVRTGSEFAERSGTIERLKQSEWLQRQERLWKDFGGPCDVQTWDQVKIAEK
jgi:WD40 repeat protein